MLVLVGLPLLTVVVVGLAWWLVPLLLVDPAGYTTTAAGRAVVDVPELTAAKTAVRAPLGIVAAALLAVMTAGAGVLVNHRTTALTRRGQDRAAERDLASRELTRRAQHNDRYVAAHPLRSRAPRMTEALVGVVAVRIIASGP
ncbi:hypothetical protein OG218_00800 [Kineococcus sp. NBC_00420]|uniref:hypothetical protein n=1 Tax=Kineococcus sp. NBC_00420 TaxID=2903564 RepID=UPI002E21A530